LGIFNRSAAYTKHPCVRVLGQAGADKLKNPPEPKAKAGRGNEKLNWTISKAGYSHTIGGTCALPGQKIPNLPLA